MPESNFSELGNKSESPTDAGWVNSSDGIKNVCVCVAINQTKLAIRVSSFQSQLLKMLVLLFSIDFEPLFLLVFKMFGFIL